MNTLLKVHKPLNIIAEKIQDMNPEDLLSKIKKGGLTISGKPLNGYAVGDNRNGIVYDLSHGIDKIQLAAYNIANNPYLHNEYDPDAKFEYDAIGFWLNPITNKVHIDPVYLIDSFFGAIRLAKLLGEISIYSFMHRSTVYVV